MGQVKEDRLAWDNWSGGAEAGLDSGVLTPPCPLTCRLPRGQYSVRIQMLGGSVQAPTNLVRCSFCTSRICRGQPALAAGQVLHPSPFILQPHQVAPTLRDPSVFLTAYSFSADILVTSLGIPAHVLKTHPPPESALYSHCILSPPPQGASGVAPQEPASKTSLAMPSPCRDPPLPPTVGAGALPTLS